MESTLAIDLYPFGLTASQVGGIFLVAAAVQLTSSQIWAHAMQKWDREVEFVIMGLILFLISSALSGPMWPIPVHNSIIIVIFRQIFFGFCSGALLNGTFAGGKKEMERYGFQTVTENNTIFAAGYQTSLSLG